MKITVNNLPLENLEAESLIIPLFEKETLPDYLIELSKKSSGAIVAAQTTGEFKGKLYETTSIFTHGKITATRIILVGAGVKKDFDERIARNVAGAAARRALKLGNKKIAFDATSFETPTVIIEGVGLAEFEGGLYKTGKDKQGKFEELLIVGKASLSQVKEASVVVEVSNWIRQKVAEPANKLTPGSMVEEAKKIAKTFHFFIEVTNEKEAVKKGMGAFAGIAQGSNEPSFMLAMKYTAGKNLPTLGVVGKGITFDSGGISIKPSERMHEMKMDMAGAATAIGFMKLVGELKPKINIVAVAPLTENLPGGKALKPGDVVKSLSGKTIEVLNTDAEGRVVLADGLTLAQKMGATKIVDLATLTGAVVVALGSEATAALGNKQVFTDQVVSSGQEVGERIWELPLYPEHKELLKSEVADIANIPPTRGAGVIAGAVFLQEFIEPKNSWVHLDIAGTAWLDSEKPFLAKGPTAVGLRTLLELTRKIEQENKA